MIGPSSNRGALAPAVTVRAMAAATSRRRAAISPLPHPLVPEAGAELLLVGDLTATLTANVRDDGTLREIFIRTGKHGSTLAGLLDTIATTVSIGLRNGVPLQNYVDHLAGLAFVPNGPTDDPDITRAASVTDYLFRRLAIDVLRPGTT